MLNYMTSGFRGSKKNTTHTIIDFEVYFNIFPIPIKNGAKLIFQNWH
jgi:hypothetical protein